MSSSLKERYKKEIVGKLMEQLNIKNIMQVPKITKITLNRGLDGTSKEAIEKSARELTMIAGQKAVITKARGSIAGFKIREGWPLGCKVTLRGERMYDFIERLVNIAIPRIRDFRGLNRKSFDGRGNYNMGVKEQTIFSEIDYDKIDNLHGLDITITTTAVDNESAMVLLKEFNFPFREA